MGMRTTPLREDPMELDQLFGLPAHPLLVHLPVVIIPMTLLLAVAAVAWRRGGAC